MRSYVRSSLRSILCSRVEPRASTFCSRWLDASWLLLWLAACGDAGRPELEGSGPQPSLDGAALLPPEAGVLDAARSDAGALDETEPVATTTFDATRPNPAIANTGDAGGSPEAGATDAAAMSDAAADAAPPPLVGDCPRALVGWATVAGDGVSTTTGGGNAAPQRPKTAAELMTLASDAQPRVIEIAGTFDVPRLEVASNKTLIGIGKDATLRGGLRIRGSSSEPVSNVILRNVRVDGATTQVDGDAVQVYFAHHVWIDHCEIWDGPDGNLDLTHAVNWVTVSWNKLRYTANYKRPPGEAADHRFSHLVGHSDNNAKEDDGRLKISFHHNWWAEGVIERMPRVRFGQVHVFNNYFASPGNNYCVRAGRGAHLLVEANHFDHVNGPHEFNSAEDEATAHITARDNVYESTTGARATAGGGTPFTSVPYAVTLDPAMNLPALVRACAAPR